MFNGIFIMHVSLLNMLINQFREGDKDNKKAVSRLLSIWQERRVLPVEYIENITKSLQGVAGPVEQVSQIDHY